MSDVKKTTQDAAETVAKETKANVKKSVDAGVDAINQGYDKFVAASREQLVKVMPEAGKNFDEAAKAGRANLDAWMKANDILVKGFEKIGQEVADFGKTASEKQMAAAKQIMGVKNVQEAIELQTGFAREAFDKWVAESTKLSEMAVKVANESAEPIQARVNETVETVSKVSKAA